MILFSIPDFYHFFNLNASLLQLMESFPTKFYEDIKIDSCYGSFPCIWNGGRVIRGEVCSEEIFEIIRFFNQKKISIRHTFTNNMLDDTDVYDKLGNMILKISENELNGINVNNFLLRDYIKEKYPQFYIMYSTTLGIDEIEEINHISETNLIVPNYKINNDFKLLEQLKHPNNIEILVGEACVDNCSNRKEHHKSCSLAQLGYVGCSDFKECPHNCEGNYFYYDTIPNRKHYISIEDIREKYLPLGINKFKISGRNDRVFNVIERYVNYLVRTEYKDDIRNRLLATVM